VYTAKTTTTTITIPTGEAKGVKAKPSGNVQGTFELDQSILLAYGFSKGGTSNISRLSIYGLEYLVEI